LLTAHPITVGLPDRSPHYRRVADRSPHYRRVADRTCHYDI